MNDADVVIVGGGFFGLRIAVFAREQLGAHRVVVLERETDLMERASYMNQARVHMGYHYPRSILTGYRSQISARPFQDEFSGAIVRNFRHYYAIAARTSKVNARSFELFCERIGAPLLAAPDNVRAMLDPHLIEDVWEATEWAFDSRELRRIVLERAAALDIHIERNVNVARIAEVSGRPSAVAEDGRIWRGQRLISAVYSHVNELHLRSGLEIIPVQQEITEMLLLAVPAHLRDSAFTIMDGPFFSLMPFPSRGLHSLSHVRYTPLRRWRERSSGSVRDVPTREELRELSSARAPIMLDVRRYLPSIDSATVVDTIREVKTVLLSSDHSDSRPILVRENTEIAGYTCVLGAKIDNIDDVLHRLANPHVSI